MAAPQDLSIEEIRKYMLENGCRVTNHSLVKHFKRFLTNPELQNEARNQFKTYVNILATIKNENNQKYLVLRKKFINECPTVKGESSGSTKTAVTDDDWASPFRHAMPNKPTPDDSQPAEQMEKNLPQSVECLTDFRKDKGAIKQKLDLTLATHSSQYNKASFPTKDSELGKMSKSIPGRFIDDAENSENIPVCTLSSNISIGSPDMKSEKNNTTSDCGNPISVKEATKKFNRMASEEEVKIISPSGKKKAEKPLIEEKITTDLLLAHPKAKEWIVVMAKASYQEVAKLANEFPELVKLQDPSTGYTAVHWAAKHGNEDVVKLIAGNYKADVNARTNGGYTPLHLAMQFGHENIFELLCNVYKADRDLTDFSGNKPLDYLKQCTSASLATYTKENADLSDASFSSEHITHNSNTLSTLRHITSGGSISAPLTSINKRSNLWSTTIPTAASSSLTRTQSMMTSSKCNLNSKKMSSTSIVTGNDALLSCGLISSNYKRNPYSQDNAAETKITSEDRHVTTLNTNRKKSFLRKTLRAATVSNRSNIAAVTSNVLME